VQVDAHDLAGTRSAAVSEIRHVQVSIGTERHRRWKHEAGREGLVVDATAAAGAQHPARARRNETALSDALLDAALREGFEACRLLAAYAEAYHREPTDLQVRRYQVDLTHGRPARGRFRIAQLSDIQADRIGSYEERALRTAATLGAPPPASCTQLQGWLGRMSARPAVRRELTAMAAAAAKARSAS